MLEISLIIAFGAVVLTSVSQIILKRIAIKNKKSKLVDKFFNVSVILAYVLLIGATFLNTIAFSVLPLKLSPIIDSLGIIIVIILSNKILKERINKYKVIGMFFICIGVFLSCL